MGNDGWGVLRQLALLTQLGLVTAISALAGIALGVELDRRLGTRFLGPLLLLAGLAAGLYSAYRLIVSVSGRGEAGHR